MAGNIYPKNIRGRIYYYYQESYREKIDKESSGKTKGTGKSNPKTKSIYIGTAEQILEMKQSKKGAVVAKYKEYGLVSAAYKTAVEIGLVDALKKHIKGERCGIERWKFFLLTIINRIDKATSKNKMGDWAKKTVLPTLLDFDPNKLTSRNYWYATDDVISEKELKEKRKEENYDQEDVFQGLGDDLFVEIEKDVFKVLAPFFSDSNNSIVYDTTNFFTFLESPKASKLAETGHNKAGRHYLRQVGLAMAVDLETGLPFFHRTYRGNRNDSRTFSDIMGDLVTSIKASFKGNSDLVLILDKGNNKKETFDYLFGKIDWIGSLTPSHHKDLLEIELDKFNLNYGKMKVYKTSKNVMGNNYSVIVTYNPSLFKKQEYTIKNSIEKLKIKLEEKYFSYKTRPTSMLKGLQNIVDKFRYKKLVSVTADKKGVFVEINDVTMIEHRKKMGKNILFTSKKDADVSWVIQNYKEKDIIEDGFKTLKDCDLIRIQPIRHFTDTKIRAFIFCSVMSYLLIKLMSNKAGEAGIKMSASILKEELKDLKEVIMIHKDGSVDKKISEKSSVQKRLAELFKI